MSRGKPKETLHHLSRKPLRDLAAFFQEMQSASDRACALVACAALDGQLADLLRFHMVPLKPEENERLFYSQNSVFGSLSSKTLAAWALGIITREEKDNIDHLRQIRNVFAHTVAQLNFEEPLIVDHCRKLIFPFIPKTMEGVEYPQNARALFAVASQSQLCSLLITMSKLKNKKITKMRTASRRRNKNRSPHKENRRISEGA